MIGNRGAFKRALFTAAFLAAAGGALLFSCCGRVLDPYNSTASGETVYVESVALWGAGAWKYIVSGCDYYFATNALLYPAFTPTSLEGNSVSSFYAHFYQHDHGSDITVNIRVTYPGGGTVVLNTNFTITSNSNAVMYPVGPFVYSYSNSLNVTIQNTGIGGDLLNAVW